MQSIEKYLGLRTVIDKENPQDENILAHHWSAFNLPISR